MYRPDAVKRTRDFYNMAPDAGIIQNEFCYFCLDKWKELGHIDDSTDLDELFGLEWAASYGLNDIGWCESNFVPGFTEEVLEDRGDHELVRDAAGRSVLYFKGRRSGFMPEYVGHPVSDMKSWEENCKWRLDPNSPERYEGFEQKSMEAKEYQDKGHFVRYACIGGYMFLRSLMGPEDLLYKFYDEPELIHDCMQTWLRFADKMIAERQKHVTVEELFIAEDICYKSGPLISPDMMREFLFPYYQELINNIKKRNADRSKRFFFQVDTDGNCLPVIDVYMELGMDYMSPFEVASGCDVVAAAKKYPDLLIRGGFDKRILAAGKDAIDREIERIMPFMKRRGGYMPSCDHGVPEEVDFNDYLHFRKRMLEYSE